MRTKKFRCWDNLSKKMKNKIMNVPAPEEEYLVVPKSWFERLVEISKMNDDKLGNQYLFGYISSAETILKYAKRTDSF